MSRFFVAAIAACLTLAAPAAAFAAHKHGGHMHQMMVMVNGHMAPVFVMMDGHMVPVMIDSANGQ